MSPLLMPVKPVLPKGVCGNSLTYTPHQDPIVLAQQLLELAKHSTEPQPLIDAARVLLESMTPGIHSKKQSG